MNFFAKNLSYLLDKTGVKQAQLASQVNKRQTAISAWKNGESEPSIENMLIISGFFGIPVGDLLEKDLSSVHLTEKTGEENKEENVHLNVHGSVHPKEKKYWEPSSRNLGVAELPGEYKSPSDEELFWRDKVVQILKQSVPEKAIESDVLQTLGEVQSNLAALQEFVLKLASGGLSGANGKTPAYLEAAAMLHKIELSVKVGEKVKDTQIVAHT